MDMRSNCGADRAGMHLGGSNMAPGREFVLASAARVTADTLSDLHFSWSNRNDGEILVTVGSIRMTVSAAIARIVHKRLGGALDVPILARAMAAHSLRLPELERVAEAAASIVEPLTERRAKLCKTVPHRETRLSAVREAIACCANENCDAAHICKIPFTAEELADIEAGLEIGAAGAIGSDAC